MSSCFSMYGLAGTTTSETLLPKTPALSFGDDESVSPTISMATTLMASPMTRLGDGFMGIKLQSPTLSMKSDTDVESPEVSFKDNKKKEYRCDIPGCEKMFTRRYNLKSHHLSIHAGERPFGCPNCTSSFSRQHDLKRHVRSVHSDTRPHKCPHCTLTFARSDALKRHLGVEAKRLSNGGYIVEQSPVISQCDYDPDMSIEDAHLGELDAQLLDAPEDVMKEWMNASSVESSVTNQTNNFLKMPASNVQNTLQVSK
ncbi:hypothetical protein HK096_008990 [Nowakowskiella sp. JEL0078]|nr:hypothetical protein HK096_008990 [Nowakowskiella sp. JEL0078]